MNISCLKEKKTSHLFTTRNRKETIERCLKTEAFKWHNSFPSFANLPTYLFKFKICSPQRMTEAITGTFRHFHKTISNQLKINHIFKRMHILHTLQNSGSCLKAAIRHSQSPDEINMFFTSYQNLSREKPPQRRDILMYFSLQWSPWLLKFHPFILIKSQKGRDWQPGQVQKSLRVKLDLSMWFLFILLHKVLLK